MRDYTDKTIFVGIDVHKKTYAITCICDNEIVKRATLKATPDVLVTYLDKFFPKAKIRTAYEAGFSGFGLHRLLLEKGITSMVVHAASVEISARDRVKTDKRDSLKLATQLSVGRLKGIHVPDPQREAWREISRLREKIAADKRRTGNRLKSLLCRQGWIGADNNDRISEKWLKEISGLDTEKSIKFGIEICVTEWRFLNTKLKEIDAELSKQAETDNYLERIYRSVPGIGPVHARILANELEDMKHFANEKQLFSFTGLTPREHSSGEHRRLGHISRQGRPVLRKTLVQAAWTAIQKDAAQRAIFERIGRSAGKKRAIIGIARRLAGQMRSCLKSNTLYRIRRVDVMEFCAQTGEVLLVANG